MVARSQATVARGFRDWRDREISRRVEFRWLPEGFRPARAAWRERRAFVRGWRDAFDERERTVDVGEFAADGAEFACDGREIAIDDREIEIDDREVRSNGGAIASEGGGFTIDGG